ncbi:MAG: hypothetical protein HY094_06975 [Candidatus Melainabacteria bacterium]|nr:hypothetical protein [Candidatus Melainabacteria bacterium]
MTAVMENKTLNKETNNINTNLLLEQISLQQLIDLALDTDIAHIEQETKQELIKRGKDNIHIRIQIKKLCKAVIANLESVLNRIGVDSKENKETIKSFKNKFLHSLSIMDRIQLEWQKYDLGLKH